MTKSEDPRGSYKDGYKFAREGGRPSTLRNENGVIVGYRAGPWLNGFRQAQIDMREELRQTGVAPLMPRRFKMTTNWKK